MLSTLAGLLPKVLLSIAMKLLTEEALEALIIFALDKLAKSTKTTVDDELVVFVKKSLGKADDK